MTEPRRITNACLDRLFVNREMLLWEIFGTVGGEYPGSMSLFGPRGIGKSALLREVGRILGAVSGSSGDERRDNSQLAEIYREVRSSGRRYRIISCGARYGKLHTEDAVSPFQDFLLHLARSLAVDVSLSATVDEITSKLIRGLRAEREEERIILIVDRADDFLVGAERSDLAVLQPLSMDFSFLLATRRPLSRFPGEVTATISSFLDMADSVAVGLLSARDAKALIAGITGCYDGASLDAGEIDAIFNLAGGHPYLIRQVMRAYLLARASQGITSPEDELFMAQVGARLQPFFLRWWKDAGLVPETTISAPVRLPARERLVKTLQEVMRGDRIGSASLQRRKETLAYLMGEVMMVGREEENLYLPGRLFQNFVREQLAEEQVIPVEEEVIAMLFSPVERRLYNYLLQNQGRYCTVAEILHSVWGESLPGEGQVSHLGRAKVTETMRRLRKQLEGYPELGKVVTKRKRGYQLMRNQPVE